MDPLQLFVSRHLTLTNALLSLVLVKLMLSRASGWELALCFFFGICNTAYGRFLDAKNDERLRIQNTSFAHLVDKLGTEVVQLRNATAKDLETLRDALGKINLALSIRPKTHTRE